jgi:hypothetical protein
MHNAYYSASIDDFIVQGLDSVLGELAKGNPSALGPLQRNAWLNQIELLQTIWPELLLAG